MYKKSLTNPLFSIRGKKRDMRRARRVQNGGPRDKSGPDAKNSRDKRILLHILPQSSTYFDPEAHPELKNLRIHPISRRNLGNLIFRSGQRLYQEIISRNVEMIWVLHLLIRSDSSLIRGKTVVFRMTEVERYEDTPLTQQRWGEALTCDPHDLCSHFLLNIRLLAETDYVVPD